MCMRTHSLSPVQEAASCFQPLSRWCPRHVPLLKWGWKQEAASWTPAGRLGWDWIRRLDNNRMEPLNAGWWVWPLSFSPGNKARQGRVRESGHKTARGEDRKTEEARQVGRRERVNHDSKVTLIAHKTWGKSVSHILFFLKTDTCKTPVPVTKQSISKEMHVDWRRDLGRIPLKQLCMFRILQHWTGMKHKIQAKYARFHFPFFFF